MASLLIVDDEKDIRFSLVRFFDSLGYQVSEAENGARASAMLAHSHFDLVLTDFKMAEMDGLELLNQARQIDPDSLGILMTAYATVESAVAAIKAGAYDYVTKPFTLEQIQLIVERALQVQSLQAENRALRDAIEEAPMLVSHSPAMEHLLESALQAALSESPVLLMGESGTRQEPHRTADSRMEPAARSPLYRGSTAPRCQRHLLESELFGHVRGSFSGAAKDKPGRLLAADSGTVFLDEIADLPGPLQSKFLRFIEEQNFEPLGDNHLIRVDTRIIAASNQDIRGRSRRATFSRGPLLPPQCHHLLRVPPLRERREDNPAVGGADAEIRGDRPPSPAPVVAIAGRGGGRSSKYHWPGNVRQLRNSASAPSCSLRVK